MNKELTNHWEHFPHKADIGIRGIGKTLADAFAQAAIALIAVMTDPDKIKPEKKLQITCNAPDNELLFIDWLNAILYEIAVRHMLFSKFDVNIEKNKLTAAVWGEKINIKKHKPTVEIKAATYTELNVTHSPEGSWIAQCVVDI